MKKRKKLCLGLVLALMVTMFMGAKTDTVYAASYPEVVFDYSETSESVTKGDMAKIAFTIYPVSYNETYHLSIYNEAGERVTFKSGVYINSSMTPKPFTLVWNTANVEPGVYTVALYVEYFDTYTVFQTLQRNYATIKITKPCDGHIYKATYVGSSYIQNECSKCGFTNKVAFPEATGGSQPMYRLYLPTNGEHLYTSDRNEVTVLAQNNGWTYEGVGWYAPLSGTPVYRLYNSGLKNHLYTSDLNEGNTLTALDPENWHWDNNAQPLFYSGGSVPIYRVYNEGLSGMHHLTTDSNEYATLPAYGWVQEGISIYAVN